MHSPDTTAELCVLLTPRAPGGHEVALLGWLGDAVAGLGLRACVVAPGRELQEACVARALPVVALPGSGAAVRWRLLRLMWAWPRQRPVLLAPGVLHTDAWLLAAAVLLRRQVWVYVPNVHSAVHMGFRGGAWRDRLLAPVIRQASGWLVLDTMQADALQHRWGVRAPVQVLPNLARVRGAALPPPAAQAQLRVAFVGRFDLWGKGLDWLGATLRARADWAPLYHWRLQGCGPGEAWLWQLADDLGAARMAVLPQAPIQHALAASDVLLLCSRFEGQPLVALEATVLGRPVVASRRSGLNDLLPASSLFDFGDAEGLARALESLRCPEARAAAVAHARAAYAAPQRLRQYRVALTALVAVWRAGRPAAQGNTTQRAPVC
jgi:glycosyltransferase involved in cell wall biosynthesis